MSNDKDKLLIRHENGYVASYDVSLADAMARKAGGKKKIYLIAPDDLVNVDATDEKEQDNE